MSIILTESVPNPLGGCEPLGPIYAGHDARMRPLAGMAAHRAATLAREVPRGGHHPDCFEGLSVRPVAPVSRRAARNRALRGSRA